MSAVTLTFGDRAENHKGMEIIGQDIGKGHGLSYNNLINIASYFSNNNYPVYLYDLRQLAPEYTLDEAFILIIPNGVSLFTDSNLLYEEAIALPWDTKAFMYGQVKNKHARHNLTFDTHYRGPNYEQGEGTIIGYSSVPHIEAIYNGLSSLTGYSLKGEGNLYFNPSKCGIGYHGDSERRIAIGVRLGVTIPLTFSWFLKNKPIGGKGGFMLNSGDIYIMSEKVVGTDWKSSSFPTLRHAAGCNKYTDL